MQLLNAIKILNKRQKKYTTEQAKQILQLLNQLSEIAYEQFKQTKANETGNIIHTSIHRSAG